jgi:hypothetical protein
VRRRRDVVRTRCWHCGARCEARADMIIRRLPVCDHCLSKTIVFDRTRRQKLPKNLMASYQLDHRGQPRSRSSA